MHGSMIAETVRKHGAHGSRTVHKRRNSRVVNADPRLEGQRRVSHERFEHVVRYRLKRRVSSTIPRRDGSSRRVERAVLWVYFPVDKIVVGNSVAFAIFVSTHRIASSSRSLIYIMIVHTCTHSNKAFIQNQH